MAEEEERYFLVAEEGYLIVYDKGKETTDLFTHMPLAEFPEEEQERLMIPFRPLKLSAILSLPCT